MRSFLPLVAFLSLAAAQNNSTNTTTTILPKPTRPANPFEVRCPAGFKSKCCPCISSGPTLCANSTLSCSLSECSQHHPNGWACCVGTGANKNRYCAIASMVRADSEVVFIDGMMGMTGMQGMEAMDEDATMMFEVDEATM